MAPLQWLAASRPDKCHFFVYVFGLQYPRALHCRIVPIEKFKTLVALERKKRSITLAVSQSERSNLKVTRKFAKTPHGLHDGGCEYYHETFVRHHSNLTNKLNILFVLYFNLYD
jgi:hypothetical protein